MKTTVYAPRTGSITPSYKWLLIGCVLAAIPAFTVSLRAQGPVTAFHEISPVPGGTTVIRDATRVGGVIHAVGSTLLRTPPTGTEGCLSPCFKMDTAFVWQSDTGVVQALPDFVTNTSPLGLNGASAISADGRYLASQARLSVSTIGQVALRAVRVDRNSLPLSSANLNVANFLPTPLTGGATTAVAISTDGTVLYGQNPQPAVFASTSLPMLTFSSRYL